MIIADRLVCNYTQAIFNAATDNINIIEVQIIELNELINQLKNTYNQKLFNEAIGKKILIQAVQKVGFHNIVFNLFTQLMRNSRLDILPSICQYLPILILNKTGICRVEVRSISQISNQEADSIKKHVKNYIDKDVSIKNIVDHSLLGGWIISFETFLFDNSIISKLNSIKKLYI